MDFLWDILAKPFAELRPAQQIVLVSLLLASGMLLLSSMSFAVRRLRQRRLHARRALLNPIEITWEEQAGVKRHCLGHCLDISAGGLKMEIPDPIEISTVVEFRVVHTNLTGSGWVRYCTATGSRHTIGLEFRTVDKG